MSLEPTATPPVEEIRQGDLLLGIILRHSYDRPGIHFITPGEFSQQLAYMRHPAGKIIEAHIHNPVPRAIKVTQEVLLIRRGRVRVDFYGTGRNHVTSRFLGTGDVIMLAAAGHGFEILEETEMIEVKQGPYIGDADKTRFPGITTGMVGAA